MNLNVGPESKSSGASRQKCSLSHSSDVHRDFLAHVLNLLFHMKTVSSHSPDPVLVSAAKLEARLGSPFALSAFPRLARSVGSDKLDQQKSKETAAFVPRFLILSFSKGTTH